MGATLFLLLKSLGEVAFLLADVGDGQRDVVELLLDVRENTDPRPEPRPEPGPEVGPEARGVACVLLAPSSFLFRMLLSIIR